MGPALLASILVPVLLVPLGYSLVRGVIAQGQEPPERPDPIHGSRCVVDEARGITTNRDMRLKHWELLLGIREGAVRYGERGKINLGMCRECHTSRERFCDRCHNAVSLTPDCFHCHYYPD
jgi:hypothetical protein